MRPLAETLSYFRCKHPTLIHQQSSHSDGFTLIANKKLLFVCLCRLPVVKKKHNTLIRARFTCHSNRSLDLGVYRFTSQFYYTTDCIHMHVTRIVKEGMVS